ncbi:MAG: M50 family metallopeptidase [Planctomycetes bacterium]|nr:M50 family metallopeptidase [Planctomycetota bacterium]MCB9884095.1 M50 family metallopeptidase [Planctomycetota bacterium]
MIYRDFDNGPGARLMRVVTRTFRIGHFFGVQVRMYWAAALLMPLVFLRWIGPASSGAAEAILLSVLCCAALFVIIWTHEMGHILMGRRHRIRTDLITLSPFGGVAHMNAPATSPRMEALIALAGPAVHLIWLAVCWPIWLLLPASFGASGGWSSTVEFTLWFLVTTNVSLLLFNLLPVWALDGGRVLRALLAMRVHPNRATLWATTVGLVGGGMMIVYGLFGGGVQGAVLVVIGISCMQSSLHERRAAQYVLVYHRDEREPWATDPDAWRHGPLRKADDTPRKQPGAIARWRQRRRASAAARRLAEKAELDAQTDAILDRVHQVGMDGLDARERAILQRASKQRRETG